jgi:hypothetical protein
MDNPIIDEHGHKFWYLNGKFHRTNGPAIEYANGHKRWYLNGIRHRTDGPACEYADGRTRWYFHHQRYTFDEWLEVNPHLTHEQKVMMKLQYG